jgi:hypothetical protein
MKKLLLESNQLLGMPKVDRCFPLGRIKLHGKTAHK